MTELSKDGCVKNCTKCAELTSSRTQIVNGTGPIDTDILVVGEAPGETEDKQGEPFVGKSGQKLTETLEENNIPRESVRITNLVRCRPPENRDPKKSEQNACINYLYQEISLINPDVIITVGKVPSEAILERDVYVTKEAGDIDSIKIDDTEHQVLICPHPASIFYNRSLEEPFQNTFKKAYRKFRK